jgi:ABC-type transporter Mla maintaining outer membrane lipid asymmetry ATPase subunit MlaF
LRKRTSKLLAELGHYERRLVEEEGEIAAARKQIRAAEKAQAVTQSVAQLVQQQAHERIARVVSRCLAAVFDEPYDFKVVFESKRGRTEARLVFVRGGHELSAKEVGGGVCDVAAFALRLACVVLTRPPVRRFVVMDEPFRSLQPAEYYHPRVRDLIYALADEMGMQFLLVAHDEELLLGKVVRIE